MGPRQEAEAHPRRTVEILDDAWRIYFADPQLLLALTALFYLPAATCLVWVIAEPGEDSRWHLLLPALTALLLPLTGLSAGACQEVFYSWAEGYPVSLGECLKAACQRGMHHIASQALKLLGPVALLVCLLSELPGGLRMITVSLVGSLTFVWMMFSLTLHPSFAAGKPRFWRAVRYGVRASGQQFGRAFLLMSMRAMFLLFAILNLHLLGIFMLWVAENLGGFDVAYLGVLCSLGNSAYLLALTLLAWCSLSPVNEAANYLFFMDVRTRTEGLDLWNRVESFFPVVRRRNAGAILLALGVGLVTAGPALAQNQLNAVRSARKELQEIRNEVKTTLPYPGGQRWMARLEAVGASLEISAAKPDGHRWFHLAIADFPDRSQGEALDLLDDLDARLALVEDSLSRPRDAGLVDAPSKDHIKGLVPPEKRSEGRTKIQPEEPKDKAKDRQRLDDDKGPADGFGKPVGPGLVSPISVGGAASGLLILLTALGVAALIAGGAYLVYEWWQQRPKAAARQVGALTPGADDVLVDPEKQDPADLWRQADERARSGNYLGAVRTIYLAVLALLHQGGFIRYERTRTNGEYADQLRPRSLLQVPFLGLTSVFEVKWYGERDCALDDYRRCRELAEEIRVGSVVS
jgi:hypothetical protein